MFDKLREKWRKSRELKARSKAVFNAIGSGSTESVRDALDAVREDGITDDTKGAMLKAAIERQDVGIFREVLIFVDDPNTTISYTVSTSNSTRTYTYSPIAYAIQKVSTHDISLYLANNPRVVVSGDLLDSAKSGGMQDVASAVAKRLADQSREEARLRDRESAYLASDGKEGAAQPAAPGNGSEKDDAKPSDETWALMSKTSVARVTASPVINRKLTEIFNFESRERVLITENLKTGAESIGAAEPFDKLSAGAVRTAEDMLAKLNADASKKTFSL